MPGGSPIPNRYIKSDLKSHRILWEEERPIRWPYMKILREYSTLKEFYPEINPYVEAYKMRENVWALFQESMDGAGDLWMYVINGPERVLLIDTGFGVGDLKGLVQHLVGTEKEILVANTHHHYDHAYGNAQFDRCYCHQDEAFSMRRTMTPHIWDYLFDENGRNIYTEFDRRDIIPYRDYELIPIPTGYRFDLGGGYEVEAIPLRGHSAGQCAYLDHHNHIIFTGDIGGAGRKYEGDPCADNCTIETLWRDMQVVVSRLDEIEAMFPGHGMLDVTSSLLRYELDALDRIMKNPENADSIKTVVRKGLDLLEILVALGKLFPLLVLGGKGLDHTLPQQTVLDGGVQLTNLHPLLAEPRPQTSVQVHRHHAHQRHAGKHCQRQRDAGTAQDDKGRHDLDARNEKLLRAVVGKLGHIEQVVGDAAHDGAHFGVVVIGVVQPQQVVKGIAAHIGFNVHAHDVADAGHIILGGTVNDAQHPKILRGVAQVVRRTGRDRQKLGNLLHPVNKRFVLGCFGLVRRSSGRGFRRFHCNRVRVLLQELIRIIFVFHILGHVRPIHIHRQTSNSL